MSSAFLESTSLSTRALDFLLVLHDADAGREELIGTLCGVAEELQSGAIAGGTIIDVQGATFERVVFPSLPEFALQHALSQPDCAALYWNLRSGDV